MSKGHIFRLETLDNNGEILTAPELEVQLQKIKDMSIALGPAQGVPFLTSMERTSWAEVNNKFLIDVCNLNQIKKSKRRQDIVVWKICPCLTLRQFLVLYKIQPSQWC